MTLGYTCSPGSFINSSVSRRRCWPTRAMLPPHILFVGKQADRRLLRNTHQQRQNLPSDLPGYSNRRPCSVHVLRQLVLLPARRPATARPRSSASGSRPARSPGSRSPNTVRLYDFGVSESGSLYFVMELLRGLDLFALVKGFGPLPPERVVSVLRQACRSLGRGARGGPAAPRRQARTTSSCAASASTATWSRCSTSASSSRSAGTTTRSSPPRARSPARPPTCRRSAPPAAPATPAPTSTRSAASPGGC